MPGGIATGLVVAAAGVWLVMRTIVHDDSGNNLVDRLFGLDHSAASKGGDTATGSGSQLGLGQLSRANGPGPSDPRFGSTDLMHGAGTPAAPPFRRGRKAGR